MQKPETSPAVAFLARLGHVPLTTIGWWLLATVAVLLLIGLMRSINLVVLLAYLLLAALLLNLVFAPRQLRRLQARRRLPEQLVAGQPCAVEVEVSFPGGSRRGVLLEDGLPQQRLTWFLPWLRGSAGHCVRREVVLPRRGRYVWGALVASSSYPFDLLCWRRPLLPPLEVVVVPCWGWLHRGRMLRYLRGIDRPRLMARAKPRCQPMAQNEFHGLRPYRPGDNLRSIHWRTSARCGELMVREYEDQPGENLLLVVDPSVGEVFEQAVSLAATLCHEWSRRPDDRLVLVLAGRDVVIVEGGTGAAFGRQLLEALAVVEAGPPAEGRRLADRLARLKLPPVAVVLIGPAGSNLISALRQALQRPVACLDPARLRGLDFYRPPEERPDPSRRD
jgi:uncharacterized protein (DUF58 family)